MGARGPAPRPALAVVRDGNPGHRNADRLDGGIKLPPAAPAEPDWATWFPGETGAKLRRRRNETDRAFDERRAEAAAVGDARTEAARIWSKVVAQLDPAGLLATVDEFVLTDLCVCLVRLQQAEQDVSRNGLRQLGERGWQRNGSITTAQQYRQQFKWLAGQLGLTPVARDSLKGGGDDPGESPFDV